jgi:hypothetical protein
MGLRREVGGVPVYLRCTSGKPPVYLRYICPVSPLYTPRDFSSRTAFLPSPRPLILHEAVVDKCEIVGVLAVVVKVQHGKEIMVMLEAPYCGVVILLDSTIKAWVFL